MPLTPITQLQVPASMAELLSNSQRVQDAFNLLNMLLAMRVQLTPPSSTKGLVSLTISGENIILPLPIRFNGPIADSSATAASVSTQLNLLLVQLRNSGINPS